MTKNVLMMAQMATAKSLASLKAWILLCLVMLSTAGVNAQIGTPYAVWCQGNGTLYFTTSDIPFHPGTDETFDGQYITQAWGGDAVTNSGVKPLWIADAQEDLKSNITRIVFNESFSSVKPASLAEWFAGFEKLTTINGLGYLNTSETTNMAAMFADCKSLTNLDVTSFSTGNVENMSGMFASCSSLENLDMTHFDTGNVKDMASMFNGCSALTSLDLSHFNTAKVTSMLQMFSDCSNLAFLDLGSLQTGAVVSLNEMFKNCSNLKVIYCDNDWNTSNVNDYVNKSIFANCTSLVGGNGTAYDSNHLGKDYARIDREGTPGYFTKKPYVIWCEGNGTLYFTNPATGSYAAGDTYNEQTITEVWRVNPSEYIDELPQWEPATTESPLATTCTKVVFDESFQSVKPKSLRRWFCGLAKMTSIEGLQYLNTSETTDMSGMFMFCENLENVDLSSFNTENVTSMEAMFYRCKKLTTLDLSNFNTENVTKFEGMFFDCFKLTTLDLSNFKAGKQSTTFRIFYSCRELTTIYCDNDWEKNEEQSYEDEVFGDCGKLVGGNGTKYNQDNKGIAYARVDREGSPGYFTKKPYALWIEDINCLVFTCKNDYFSEDGTKYNGRTITAMWSGDAIIASDVKPLWTDEVKNKCTDVSFHESFKNVKPTSLSFWFSEFKNLVNFRTKYLDASKVTSMNYMFNGCEKLSRLEFYDFETSKATNMAGMFMGCKELTTVDLNGFNTSNVKNMNAMFYGCEKLASLNLGSFDVRRVRDFAYMFNGCSALATIYSNDDWAAQVSSSATSYEMFSGCDNLKGGCGTSTASGVYDIAYAHLDAEGTPGYFTVNPYVIFCEGDNTLYFTVPSSGSYSVGGTYNGQTITSLWCGEPVTNTGQKVYWCSLSSQGFLINAEKVVIDQSFSRVRPTSTHSWFCINLIKSIEGLEYLNTSQVTDMCHMFSTAKITSLDLSHFDTGNVTNMNEMFYYCPLTELDLSSFKTDKVTNMNRMFADCTELKAIYVDNDWKTDQVSDAKNMFFDCSNLCGGNGTAYDSNQVGKDYARIDREGTPGYFTKKPYAIWCEGNSTLYFTNPETGSYAVGDTYDMQTITKVWRVNLEVGNLERTPWDTATEQYLVNGCTRVVFEENFSSVRPKSTVRWFNQFESLTSIEGIEYLNTSKVTNMKTMFAACKSLESLDLSHFDTSNVTNMDLMFNACISLTSLDLSSFNTANVTTMQSMFSSCYELTSLDLSGFTTDLVVNSYEIFAYCKKLTTIYCNNDWNLVDDIGNNSLFDSCEKLVGGNGTAYARFQQYDKEYARVDRPWNPGFFTKKPYVIWCEGNGTLYFTNPETGSYAVGDTYDMQTITKVWRVNLEVGDLERTPWDTATEQYLVNGCTRVVFDENFSSVRPKSTVRWFNQFESLTSIEGIEYLNTSKVTNMKTMFAACKSLTSLDLSHFDTSNVTNMDLMFNACISLTSLDLSSFNTANVTTMQSMFSSCYELTSLDLSRFTTDLVVNTFEIFAYCKKLTTIYCNNDWNLSDNSENTLLFASCEKLVGGNGTAYSSFHRYDKECARVDRPGTQGYFTTRNTFDYTISDAMVGTLYLDYPVYVPSDEDYFNAYYVKSISETGTIHLKAMKDVIPAYTGVIIFGNEGSYKLIKYSGEVTAIEGNKLKGVLEDTSVSDLEEENGTDIYILSRGKDKGSYIDFYKAGGSIKTIPANRAYLPYTSSNNVKELSVSFDDDEDATGISDIAIQDSIDKAAIYNLAGQRVVAPTHGVFIVNGKKVFIR